MYNKKDMLGVVEKDQKMKKEVNRYVLREKKYILSYDKNK